MHNTDCVAKCAKTNSGLVKSATFDIQSLNIFFNLYQKIFSVLLKKMTNANLWKWQSSNKVSGQQ